MIPQGAPDVIGHRGLGTTEDERRAIRAAAARHRRRVPKAARAHE